MKCLQLQSCSLRLTSLLVFFLLRVHEVELTTSRNHCKVSWHEESRASFYLGGEKCCVCRATRGKFLLCYSCRVLKANGGLPPHTYRLFGQVVSTLGRPPRPVRAPDFSGVNTPIPDDFEDKFAIPSVKELGVSLDHFCAIRVLASRDLSIAVDGVAVCVTDRVMSVKVSAHLRGMWVLCTNHFISSGPPPESARQENPPFRWMGGETKALELLRSRLVTEENVRAHTHTTHMETHTYTSTFHLSLLSTSRRLPMQAYRAGYVLPNQYKPDLIGAPMSMSPHLRFGCLSIRKFYWDQHDLFAEVSEVSQKYRHRHAHVHARVHCSHEMKRVSCQIGEF